MADLGTDLLLTPAEREPARAYTVVGSRDVLDRPVPDVAELPTVSGRDNLGQALLIRLLTPRGELAALGHPGFGSSLHEVIGRPNTPTTRGLIRLHVLTALAEEPRVAKVVRVEVAPVRGRRHLVTVDVAVLPQLQTDPLQLPTLTLDLEVLA